VKKPKASTKKPPVKAEWNGDDLGIDSDPWRRAYRRSIRVHGTIGNALRYFTQIFEEAPAPYIVTTPRLTIVDANFAAQKMLRRSLAVVRGKPLPLMVAASDRPVFRQMVGEILQSRTRVARPLTIRPVGGEEFEIIFNATVIRDSDEMPVYVFWLFLDSLTPGNDTFL
jgi:PAS domain S-box-containing protein